MAKTLVLYFSTSGRTKKVAEKLVNAVKTEMIANEAGGDIYEIVPSESYTDEDLNYNNSRTNKEQNDTSYKPEIANELVKLPNMLFIWAILFLGKLFPVTYRHIWKNMI